jgi:hypothetical protein
LLLANEGVLINLNIISWVASSSRRTKQQHLSRFKVQVILGIDLRGDNCFNVINEKKWDLLIGAQEGRVPLQ